MPHHPHEATSREVPLVGGFVAGPVRAGATVRRTMPDRAEFVHRLLGHFERLGWPGAPRYLGVDERGRQVLSYLPGPAALTPEAKALARTDTALVATARLVREFHDLTAGTALAGGHEVVCHNDLDPRNTIYRQRAGGMVPIAFIDWDIAAPGARVHDVARICWQYAGWGRDHADVTGAGRQARLIADAYRLTDRAMLVDTVLWWQQRCAQGIAAGAARGEPAMVRLREAGVVDTVRADRDWVCAHRAELSRALLP